jgi:hypothetical protein
VLSNRGLKQDPLFPELTIGLRPDKGKLWLQSLLPSSTNDKERIGILRHGKMPCAIPLLSVINHQSLRNAVSSKAAGKSPPKK